MSDTNPIIKKIMIAIIGLIILAIVAFIFIRPLLVKKDLPKPIAINTHQQPTIGNPKAKIHFVVFEDLKCVNCARFSNEIFPIIQKEYIDTNRAKYTMINLAFVPGSMPAANAARCVYTQSPALFFDYIKTIYKNQPPEEENWATVPKLMIFASKIKGLNTDQFSQCLVQSPYDQVIQNNLQLAIKAMGHNVATPTVYINGILVNPLTKSQIKKVINVLK